MAYTAHSLSVAGLRSLEYPGPSGVVPQGPFPRGTRPLALVRTATDPIDELRAAIPPTKCIVLVPGTDPIPDYRLAFYLRAAFLPRVLVQA
jgi:hypothetical protein